MADDHERADHGRETGIPALSMGSRLAAAWVTVTIIAVCLVAFAGTLAVCATRVDAPGSMLAGSWIQLRMCEDTMKDAGALHLSSVWLDGSWWRVISAGFLHGSVLHVVLNIWSLWVVGEWAERAWGHARAAVLFGVSSVMGCLASAAWVEAPMVVGASAGIMGMAGALLVGRLIGRGAVGEALRPISAKILGGWLVVLVALGFFVDMIAQAGHLGGLVAGLLLGLAWSGREPAVGLAGRVGVGIAMTALVVLARQPEGRANYYEFLGYGYLDRGADEAAIGAFEKALEREPKDAELANAVAYGLAKEGIRLEYAEELVRRALVQDGENADYLDTLGWIFCRRGDALEGMEYVRRASVASGGEVEEIEEHLEDCASAAVES